MAKVAKKEVPQPPVVEITLTLDQNEAETLRDILMHVGGITATSRRKYARDVLYVLTSVVRTQNTELSDLSGSLHFKDSLKA